MEVEVQPLAGPGTVKDHPRELYPAVKEMWSGPPPSRAGHNNPDDYTTRWEWDEKLSPQDQNEFDRVVNAARRGFQNPQDYTNAEFDLATCRDFLNIQNPTTAQNAAAIKAIIRSMQQRFLI